MVERRCAYRVLVGKPEGKRPLEKPGHRWVDNIKLDLQERDLGRNWIDLPQDTERWRYFVKELLNVCVLQNVQNFLTS